MDLELTSWLQGPSATLMAGSAILALGMSVLVAVALFWLRARRRAARASVESLSKVEFRRNLTTATGRDLDTLDEVVPAVPSNAAPAMDLSAIDSRLEEVEAQLEFLQTRIDSLVHTRRVTPVHGSETVSSRSRATAASPEERALREMVARSE